VARPNQLEELSDQQRQAVLLGADALHQVDAFKRKSFDLWMTAARGVAILCDLAAARTSRKARKNLLKDNGYGSLNEGTVSRLRWMAKLETAIRTWRDTLTENKRDSWNSPTSICNRCPAVRKAIAEANRTRPPRPKKAVNKPKALESAIDFILDHLHETEDADHRLAILERILLPFGFYAAPKSPEGPPPKKAKAHRTKRPAANDGPLVWEDEGDKNIEDGGKPRHRYNASDGATGRYLVGPTFIFPSKKFSGYSVTHRADATNHKTTREIKSNVRTAEQGKAIAERDHTERSEIA
jgi:hypothetical protein